jgi:hypothetical protein
MQKAMKTKFATGLLVALLLACSDDDSMSIQDEITDIAKAGTWRITYFWDTDKDETNNFTGYSFTFGSSGVLTATKGSTVITGSWSMTDSNSNDDSKE